MEIRVSRKRPARPAVRQHEGTISVYRTRAPGVEEEEERKIQVRTFVTEPAYIRINAGVTKNLGNYESFRCDVAITMPCYLEELNEITQAVSEEVSVLLEEELAKYDIKPVEVT